jgi:hypothetical protein
VINTSWSKISLALFFIIALFGSIMRLAPFSDFFITYKHLLHTHSHIAFQGWVYTILFILISNLYLDKKLIENGKYQLQLKLTYITILGIMTSFLFQGYGLFSILFSSLFQILNYWFAFRFFKDIKKSEKAKKHPFSLKLVKVGLWAMILSTLGPWTIGIISAKGFADSEYFNAALYFFLHFQYNGWFTFAIVGVFFWLLENYNIPFKEKEANFFYVFFTSAVIPAYFLSLIGMSFRNYFIAFGYIAATLQIIALIYLAKSLSNCFKQIKKQFNFLIVTLLYLFFVAFSLKVLLQFASLFPFLEDLAFNNRFLIMAYIHLVMIGFISFFLLASLFELGWYKLNPLITKIGIICFILGFLLSEFILVIMGLDLSLFHNEISLLIFSFLMAFGILLILMGQFRYSSDNLKSPNE